MDEMKSIDRLCFSILTCFFLYCRQPTIDHISSYQNTNYMYMYPSVEVNVQVVCDNFNTSHRPPPIFSMSYNTGEWSNNYYINKTIILSVYTICSCTCIPCQLILVPQVNHVCMYIVFVSSLS